MLSFQNQYLQFSCPLNLRALGPSPSPCLAPWVISPPGREGGAAQAWGEVRCTHIRMKTAQSLMASFLGSRKNVKVLMFMASKSPRPSSANPLCDVMGPLRGQEGQVIRESKKANGVDMVRG